MESKIIYVEFPGLINDVSAHRMMDKLNSFPNTKLIHTTFIESKQMRLFVLEKTSQEYIKIVGRRDAFTGALDRSPIFVIAHEWVIGNVSAVFQLEGEDYTKGLIENTQLTGALNLSCIKVRSCSEINNKMHITLEFNNKYNMLKL